MSISSLEHFKPLDAERIKAGLAESLAQAKDISGTHKPVRNDCIIGKQNFILTIDRKFVEKHPSIRIADCKSFTINTCLQDIKPPHSRKFLIEITDCSHFTVEGINCSSGRNMIRIADSSSFTVRDCTCRNAEGCGVIIDNGHAFRVYGCRFDNNLSAGVLLIGHTFNGEIHDCSCTRSRGFFNHDAGIHLCHTSPDITSEQVPELIHEPLPITDKTRRPYHIVIRNCIITHCRAQGIYLEGAVNCLIEDNILLHNNKEGICFDWGSSYNIFCRNIVALNGERRTMTPAEIKIDYITEYPLLPDGSSSMKLPGISLDNGCMNLIRENKIAGNYGGGIKMIRTALCNSITGNQILYNAIGPNEYVPHFHGVTVLGLGAVNREFIRKKQSLLDFMPSILNSITHNTIKETMRAIFYDKLSANNFSSDNIISEQERNHCPLAATCIRIKSYLKRLSVRILHRM